MVQNSSKKNIPTRQIQNKKIFKNLIKICTGEYAACGFEVLLTRKHEPLVYQVNHLTIISTVGALYFTPPTNRRK